MLILQSNTPLTVNQIREYYKQWDACVKNNLPFIIGPEFQIITVSTEKVTLK